MGRARHLLQQANVHTIINIGGLAVGLCAGLLIALIIRTETHYDRFLPDYERVYRVSQIGHAPGREARMSDTVEARVSGWLKTDFPEVFEAVGRISQSRHTLRRGSVEAY